MVNQLDGPVKPYIINAEAKTATPTNIKRSVLLSLLFEYNFVLSSEGGLIISAESEFAVSVFIILAETRLILLTGFGLDFDFKISPITPPMSPNMGRIRIKINALSVLIWPEIWYTMRAIIKTPKPCNKPNIALLVRDV